MLFLMNDVVLNLDKVMPSQKATAWRYRRLSLDFICELGAELYAEIPLLQVEAPERAARLAAMIVAKDPKINAGLFVAPAFHCAPEQVSVRLTTIPDAQMAELWRRQQSGALNNLEADRQVWRRLAA
ncbi:MAG TPA: hypothetical protein VG939_05690 [Caulobacteraceae bacterium]|nr:hypothetical protein [Caulobacteraceae bacterium]